MTAATGSGGGLSDGVRGNDCFKDTDRQLMAAATADYSSVLVTSYGPITAERVVGLLRAAGGQYASSADHYQVKDKTAVGFWLTEYG